jgi:hypothetical protein
MFLIQRFQRRRPSDDVSELFSVRRPGETGNVSITTHERSHLVGGQAYQPQARVFPALAVDVRIVLILFAPLIVFGRLIWAGKCYVLTGGRPGKVVDRSPLRRRNQGRCLTAICLDQVEKRDSTRSSIGKKSDLFSIG